MFIFNFKQRARLALLAKSKMAQQSGGLFSSMLPLMAMSGGTDNMLNMMLFHKYIHVYTDKKKLKVFCAHPYLLGYLLYGRLY
jgi:hypothetical protein